MQNRIDAMSRTAIAFLTACALFVGTWLVPGCKSESIPPAGPIDQITEALDLFVKGNADPSGAPLRKAEKILLGVLESNPDYGLAYEALCRIYHFRADVFFGNDREKANLRALEMCTAAWDNGTRTPELISELSMLNENNHEVAVKYLEEGFTLFPQLPTIRKDLGLHYYELKEYEKARMHLRAVVAETEPGPQTAYDLSQAHDYLGRMQELDGKLDAARKSFLLSADIILEHNKKHPEQERMYGCPFKALGKMYAATGQREKATDYMIQAAEQDPRSEQFQFDAASHAFDLGYLRTAQFYLDRIPPHWNRNWITQLRARIETALAEPRQNPESLDERSQAALVAFRSGISLPNSMDPKEKIAMRRFVPFLIVDGFDSLLNRNYDAAKLDFDEATRITPSEPGAMVGRAHIDLALLNWSSAEALFEHSIAATKAGQTGKLCTTSTSSYDCFVREMAYLGRAWLHANRAEHEKALSAYERVLAGFPDHFWALLGKGGSLTQTGKLDAAKTVFAKALSIQPNNPYAMADAALVHLNEGDLEKAESKFRSALDKSDGRFTCPYEGLGLIYLRQGKLDQAKKNLSKAIEINPDIEYKKFNALAKILLEEGKTVEAIKLLEKSVENYPFDNEAQELLKKIKVNPVGDGPGSEGKSF
jgi:tetratricopeptide (TPR) repeat protein